MTAILSNDRRSLTLASVGLLFLIAMCLMYVLQLGGADVVRGTMDVIAILLNLVCTAMALLLWRSSDPREISRWIWGTLALGLLLWLWGEAIWGYNEIVLKREVPMPSAADIGWVIGYLPLFAALILRYRSAHMTPTRTQLAMLLGSAAVILVVVLGFVIVPIVTYPDYESPLVQFIDTLYPLGDLGLALIALLIVSVFSGGALSRPWVVIGAGFLVLSIADLLLVYATWNEIYLTQQPNLITTLTDLLYPSAYLVLAAGLYYQARVYRLL